MEWIRRAASRLRRGFILLFDYGHEARILCSASHAGGTLTAFASHTMAGPERSSPSWLDRPGDQDITARRLHQCARGGGRRGHGDARVLDQTYFVLGLVHDRPEQMTRGLALKTLMMPGARQHAEGADPRKSVGQPSLRAAPSGSASPRPCYKTMAGGSWLMDCGDHQPCSAISPELTDNTRRYGRHNRA